LAATALIRATAIGLLAFASTASAETISARYEVYTGGFKALSIQARAAIGDRAYEIDADLKTTGVIDWILRFTQKLEGRGQIETTATPRRYVSDGTFFGTHRSIRLDYRPDGGIDALLDPPNNDDDRTPVPEAMKAGTIDPVTAFVALNRAAAASGSPCSGKMPIFDGRRRFNLVFEEDGLAEVEPSQYTVFSGQALRCKVHMERLAGFQQNPRFNARTPRVSILYVARFGEREMWIPVRLESDSSFGLVIGHLVEVDAPARPLGRGPRPAS
jgi:hypothetical protein